MTVSSSRPDPDKVAAAVDAVMPLAEKLFADLRTHTGASEGVSRESYGEGEQYAHDLLKTSPNRFSLKFRLILPVISI